MIEVYRIQPKGAKLHAIESLDSNDMPVGGVFVFTSFPQISTSGWLNQRNVELVKIVANERDIIIGEDEQGDILLKGRGRIVKRIPFRDIRSLHAAVDEMIEKELSW